MLLVILNINSHQYEAFMFMADQLLKNDEASDYQNINGNNNPVLVGHPMYYRIPKYFF